MKHLALATVVTAGAVVAGGLAAAPDAHAASIGTCTLVVPSRVSISHEYRAIPLSIKGGCAARSGSFASWDLYHPTHGLEDVAYFDGKTKDTWDLYSFHDLGAQRWRPEGAFTGDFVYDFSQNSPVTTIKIASSASIRSSRSGSRVTLTAHSARYAISLDRVINYRGVAGTLQYRSIGSKTWHGLKSVKTNSLGSAKFTYTSRSSRYYRVVFKETGSVWGATSSTTRR